MLSNREVSSNRQVLVLKSMAAGDAESKHVELCHSIENHLVEIVMIALKKR